MLSESSYSDIHETNIVGPAVIYSMMKSTLHRVNRLVRKWYKIEEVLGVRLSPYLLVVLAAAFVIVVQILLFVTMSPQIAPCKPTTTLGRFHANHETAPNKTLSMIYVITPTYARPVQLAELTRLSQTLMLVPRVHWIIVEDSTVPSERIRKFVARLQTKFAFSSITLLNESTPNDFKLKPGDPDWKYPKGVWQRNRALRWIRSNENDLDLHGVVYFADDDNTYDLEIFDEMRSTRNVAVWPVAFVGGLLVERPIVRRDHSSNSSRVDGFNARWEPNRRFPIDMAGFSISIRLVLSKPDAAFSCHQRIGHMESHFLSQFVDSLLELEPKANDCSRLLVWHTKTKNPALHLEKKLKRPSNSDMDL